MGSFRNKVAAFFSGRYGNDQLGYFNLILVLIIGFSNIFHTSPAQTVIQLLFLLLCLFRFFSRRKDKRSQENAVFLKICHKISGFFSLLRKRIKDGKTNVYRHGPHCKAPLRLSRKRGKHTVRCPKCNERFDTRIIL